METIQLILNEIIDIGGNNGIIIAGLVVSLFVIYKIASAANCTCLEAILLDKKEKKELEVERMALFAMLFTFVNFFCNAGEIYYRGRDYRSVSIKYSYYCL